MPFLDLCLRRNGVFGLLEKVSHVIQSCLFIHEPVICGEGVLALSCRNIIALAVHDVAEAAAVDIERAQRIDDAHAVLYKA